MPIISYDPYDVKSEEEFKALLMIVFREINVLLTKKLELEEKTANKIKSELYKLIFATTSENNFDTALQQMGIGVDDDLDEEDFDRVIFIRGFFMRFFSNHKDIETWLRRNVLPSESVML
jgi:hypothetical protein